MIQRWHWSSGLLRQSYAQGCDWALGWKAQEPSRHVRGGDELFPHGVSYTEALFPT